ncbi:hypothetical protein M427DRAFT_175919 [Gonapodya prolifera JEL478]|uniref:YCII-related domain-containing protein n=1 Tax=Gonapodya prolifera (strain JEL478) TaxID=1344416 RepID=A0A139APU7_GONPJ|nr:hypothetical protein M427DRAFT_175919 [Gonapodya prolifera JEL478]|eukprot:KXS18781.1 hypothetical protein M427DRAFT_175919 [Gonapodya prolifera JEL478]
MSVRGEHLARMEKAKADGVFIAGGAILSETETYDGKPKMIGSMVMTKHVSAAACRAFFEADPYVSGRVWESFEVRPFRLAETGFVKENL